MPPAAAAHPRSLLESVLAPLLHTPDLNGPQAQAVLKVAKASLPRDMCPSLLFALVAGGTTSSTGSSMADGRTAASTMPPAVGVRWGEAHVSFAQGVLDMRVPLGEGEMRALLARVATAASLGGLAASVPFTRLLLTLASGVAGLEAARAAHAKEVLRSAATLTQTFLTPAVLAKL